MLNTIRPVSQPSDPVLIFVHGILSDADACWRNREGRSWPEIVNADESFTNCGIYTFAYPSPAIRNQFSITDAADTLWEDLRGSSLITKKRQIVLVCHSLGGIVVRRMLVKRQMEFANAGVKTIGVFLVASPSMGSRWAARLLPFSWLLGNTQATALSSRESNQWLRDLRQDFTNLREKGPLQIIGKELIEDRPLRLMRLAWLSPIVLSKEGAIFFADPLKIAKSDHSTIAKPQDLTSQQHVTLRLFVRDIQQRSSRSVSKIPGGSSFEDAVRCACMSWSMKVAFRGFAPSELRVILARDQEVEASSLAELLEKLGAEVASGKISKYSVTIEDSTAILTVDKALYEHN